VAARLVPRTLLALAAAAGLASLAVGCGGAAKKAAVVAVVHVAAPGARFSVPVGWKVTRSPTTVSAAPAGAGERLLQVAVFQLLHPYQPSLWPRVVPELDKAAATLAKALKGTLGASRTVTVAGGNVRQYELAFDHRSVAVRELITFVLRGRREYEVLCRWSAGESRPAACDALLAGFKLV